MKGGEDMAIDKKTEYNMQYAKEKLKRIPLDVQKEKYAEIKAHAEKMGESTNAFIKRAIDETMDADGHVMKLVSSGK